MDAHDFLTAVLPSTGLYCVCELSSPRKRHLFVDTVESAIAGAEGFAASEFNTFFALASFKEKGSREAANAQFMRSFFVDIDIDPDGEKGLYTSKREAVVALNAFLQETHLDTLGAPWLVDSGGGVHAYWPLSNDVPIAEWRVVADRLKRAAFACSFKIDMKVTADAARVLRVPGTINYKQPGVPRPAVLKKRGATFDLKAIADLLPVGDAPINGHPAIATTLNIPGTRPTITGATPSTAVALANHIDSSFDLLLERSLAGTGCQQVKWYYDHAERANMEGLWRAMLSIAKYTTEKLDAGRMLSEWHPYDEERLQKKWIEIKGPYGCDKIEAENTGGCDGCPHRGKITNPLKLGWAIPVPAPTPAVGRMPALPAPPDGYKFDNCRERVPGLYRVFADTTMDPVLILKYPLYLEAVMKEATGTRVHFCRVQMPDNSDDVVLERFAIPAKSLVVPKEALGYLADHFIFAEIGADAHLYNYVRAASKQIDNTGGAVVVPDKYGWQYDNSFAYGDRVVGMRGERKFVSDKLQNMIDAMTPAGAFENWQRVMQMLIDKDCYEHITLALIGFASPLMGWNTSGIDAMTFHAGSAETGTGKSLALQLASSVWGSKDMILVPSTSDTTTLQRAGYLGGLPVLIDEATMKNRNSEMGWLGDFVMGFSQGKHKTRGDVRGGELPNKLKWRGLAFVTSNTPALDHLLVTRKGSTPAGEVARFLEWRSETKLNFSDRERPVLDLINTNYGHAGPLFAEWLVKNHALAKAKFVEVQKGWEQAMREGRTNEDSGERFWAAACAAILTAATLVGPNFANIWPKLNVVRVADCLKVMVQNTRDALGENKPTAAKLVANFILDNNGKFSQPRGPASSSLLGITFDPANTPRGAVVGRIEPHPTNANMYDLYITSAALQAYCKAEGHNQSYRELLKELNVREVSIDVFAGTKMASATVRCIKLPYVPPATTPASPAAAAPKQS